MCRPFRPEDRAALISLWERCDLVRPWNDPGRDVDRKLGVDPDGLIVMDEQRQMDEPPGPGEQPQIDESAGPDEQPQIDEQTQQPPRIVGSVMAGYDGHRGWVNYLAVDPERRGRGWGRVLMAAAEQRLAAAGCPKVNLQVRAGNEAVVDFYRHLGYSVDDVTSMGRRLVHDAAPHGSHHVMPV